MKDHITGIGGVFFRCKDDENVKAWYRENLGMQLESWGKFFAWRDYDDPKKPGSTTWSPFKNETDYFGNSEQKYMINYRVTDLEALLAELKEKGIEVVKKMETMDYGKFAWIEDCEGVRMELWEPRDEAFGL
jgi:predicted enzyme related to lactoylglutathione lyase